MGTTRIIPLNSKNPPELRVAAYCRISTRAAEQRSSLMTQERYYEDHIKQNPSWVFAGVYSDIGSGTRIKGRNRFKALLSACKRGKIDMILTKSAHRFARNTVDALKTIRMLRSRNIDIYIIRLNSEMSASGVSLARISAYLEDMEIPSPRGKKTCQVSPHNFYEPQC